MTDPISCDCHKCDAQEFQRRHSELMDDYCQDYHGKYVVTSKQARLNCGERLAISTFLAWLLETHTLEKRHA